MGVCVWTMCVCVCVCVCECVVWLGLTWTDSDWHGSDCLHGLRGGGGSKVWVCVGVCVCGCDGMAGIGMILLDLDWLGVLDGIVLAWLGLRCVCGRVCTCMWMGVQRIY